tara:strand:- start:239 stop:922 length:684 start_codon:yes stop_codon:yes gene_type:complete
LTKRLTVKQKEELTKLFILGNNIDQLSKQFKFAKLTISRNLKNILGDAKYKELLTKSKSNKKSIANEKKKIINNINNIKKIEQQNINNDNSERILNENFGEESSKISQFVEIAPLNCDIENTPQKDLSSVSILDIQFPKTVFMIVDKKVELEVRYLKDFPKWQFLAEDDLKRKTIEIFGDLKIAKGFCGKDQKVIKVPNTDVFKIVAPILRSRGISRIISSEQLIAL